MQPFLYREVGEEGLRVEEELPPEQFAGSLEPALYRAEQPGQLRLLVERHGDDLRVHGELRATLNATCVACLEPFSISQRFAIELNLTPLARLPASEEVRLDEESVGLDHFDPEQAIDLRPLVQEVVGVSVPAHPRCREDCQGLCPQCGGNRNLAPCTCQPAPDPRWAALAALQPERHHDR